MSAKRKKTVRKKTTAVSRSGRTLKADDSVNSLLSDLRQLIVESRGRVAQAVNSELTMLYWNVGRRIREDILQEKRANYGEQIVAALGRQLTAEFGRGFSQRNLDNMVQFAAVFPDF
jgi:hypothetical protein